MEILQFWASAYYRLGSSVRQYILDLDALVKEEGSESVLPPQLRGQLKVELEDLNFWVEPVSHSCAVALSRLHSSLGSGDAVLTRYVHGQLVAFSEYIVDALESVLFLRLPEDMALLHMEPLGPWGTETTEAFSSAIADMQGASQCLSLGQPTACVFHSMRVLEKGLHALAKSLPGFSVPEDVAYEQWGNLTNQMAKELRLQYAQMPKGPAKDTESEFYSNAVTQFQHFNEGWRIHAAHSRRSFDMNEAKAVFEHACSFMKHISQRVRE